MRKYLGARIHTRMDVIGISALSMQTWSLLHDPSWGNLWIVAAIVVVYSVAATIIKEGDS